MIGRVDPVGVGISLLIHGVESPPSDNGAFTGCMAYSGRVILVQAAPGFAQTALSGLCRSLWLCRHDALENTGAAPALIRDQPGFRARRIKRR
jgi:hypothetical protein